MSVGIGTGERYVGAAEVDRKRPPGVTVVTCAVPPDRTSNVSLLLTMTPELTTPAETNVVVMTDFPMLCCVTDWRNKSLG